MNFLAKCEACKKKALIIKKRTYDVPKVGVITSKGQLCRACYKNILKMVKTI